MLSFVLLNQNILRKVSLDYLLSVALENKAFFTVRAK